MAGNKVSQQYTSRKSAEIAKTNDEIVRSFIKELLESSRRSQECSPSIVLAEIIRQSAELRFYNENSVVRLFQQRSKLSFTAAEVVVSSKRSSSLVYNFFKLGFFASWATRYVCIASQHYGGH